jgi:Bacterial Ig domain/PKD domain
MTVFDPLTGKFNEVHSMAHGRWYATAVTLGDGRALAFSGLDENGLTNSTIEIYQVARGWTAPSPAPNQPVNFAATASDPDGPVPTTYSWYFPEGSPTTSTASNPQGVRFASTGTFVASLTVVDNLGVNDPSPPTRTIVVHPAQLVVTITSPVAKATVKGTVAVNVSIQGSTGSPNTFTLSIDGTALNSKSVNGTSTKFSWNTRQRSNGPHTISVRVTDVNGASGVASRTVTVAN